MFYGKRIHRSMSHIAITLKFKTTTTTTTFIYTFFYFERYIFKINLRAIRWKKKKANLLQFKGV